MRWSQIYIWNVLNLFISVTQRHSHQTYGDIQKSSWVIRWAMLNKVHCRTIYGDDVKKKKIQKNATYETHWFKSTQQFKT